MGSYFVIQTGISICTLPDYYSRDNGIIQCVFLHLNAFIQGHKAAGFLSPTKSAYTRSHLSVK